MNTLSYVSDTGPPLYCAEDLHQEVCKLPF